MLGLVSISDTRSARRSADPAEIKNGRDCSTGPFFLHLMIQNNTYCTDQSCSQGAFREPAHTAAVRPLRGKIEQLFYFAIAHIEAGTLA